MPDVDTDACRGGQRAGAHRERTALQQEPTDSRRPAAGQRLERGARVAARLDDLLPRRPVDDRGRDHRGGRRAQGGARPIDQTAHGAVGQAER